MAITKIHYITILISVHCYELRSHRRHLELLLFSFDFQAARLSRGATKGLDLRVAPGFQNVRSNGGPEIKATTLEVENLDFEPWSFGCCDTCGWKTHWFSKAGLVKCSVVRL